MKLLKDKYGVMVFGVCLSLLLDQITKAVIIAHFPKDGFLKIIPGFFDIYHAHNEGAAFGLFKGNPVLFFLIVSTLAVGFIFYYFIRLERHHLLMAGSLALILGGALGNMLDRVRHGFVVDFLRFYLGERSWPTFNVADIAIVLGVLAFAVDMLRTEMQMRRENTPGHAEA
ncbi:MAG: signal peptidase II [Candidatus Lernaella stagnicola]|nr:signal peptidase II [Candidatus Lernaella stagnicola]